MQLTLTMAEARTSGWGMRRTGCWAKLDRESIPITRCGSGRPGRVWSVANPVGLEVGYSRPTGVRTGGMGRRSECHSSTTRSRVHEVSVQVDYTRSF